MISEELIEWLLALCQPSPNEIMRKTVKRTIMIKQEKTTMRIENESILLKRRDEFDVFQNIKYRDLSEYYKLYKMDERVFDDFYPVIVFLNAGVSENDIETCSSYHFDYFLNGRWVAFFIDETVAFEAIKKFNANVTCVFRHNVTNHDTDSIFNVTMSDFEKLEQILSDPQVVINKLNPGFYSVYANEEEAMIIRMVLPELRSIKLYCPETISLAA